MQVPVCYLNMPVLLLWDACLPQEASAFCLPLPMLFLSARSFRYYFLLQRATLSGRWD